MEIYSKYSGSVCVCLGGGHPGSLVSLRYSHPRDGGWQRGAVMKNGRGAPPFVRGENALVVLRLVLLAVKGITG